jgi:hypothetical protein
MLSAPNNMGRFTVTSGVKPAGVCAMTEPTIASKEQTEVILEIMIADFT